MNRRFSLLPPVVLLTAAAVAAAPQQKAKEPRVKLTVKVSELRSDRGRVAVSLFAGPDGFPDNDARALRRAVVSVDNNAATLTFDDLAPGTYALVLLHDENANNKMDTSFGFPTEGFGVSNNPKPGFGPPKWPAAKFTLTTDPPKKGETNPPAVTPRTITVKTVYLTPR